MKKKNTVNPTTLKGRDQMDRIHELMGKVAPSINESKSNSVLEISRLAPDGNVYGIVRENHKYYMKIAENKENLTVNDFQYIGGLKNKEELVYESYSKATKQLKLKFISLAEAYGVENIEDTNILMGEAFSMGFKEDEVDSAVQENDFVEEDMDPVGHEDADIDNDGDVDSSDDYLKNRRDVISNKLQEELELSETEANYLIDEYFEAEAEAYKREANELYSQFMPSEGCKLKKKV